MKRVISVFFVFALSLAGICSFAGIGKSAAANLTDVQVGWVGLNSSGKWIQIPYSNRLFPQTEIVTGKELYIRVIFVGTPSGDIVFSENARNIPASAVRQVSAYYHASGAAIDYAISFKGMGVALGKSTISSLYCTAKDQFGRQYFGFATGIKVNAVY